MANTFFLARLTIINIAGLTGSFTKVLIITTNTAVIEICVVSASEAITRVGRHGSDLFSYRICYVFSNSIEYEFV